MYKVAKTRLLFNKQNSAAVTDVAFHTRHRKGYQSKLLFFHSKGNRFSS